MTESRRCDNCTRAFRPPASAPHKRFCSSECRNEWHLKQRKNGLELLKQQQLAQSNLENNPVPSVKDQTDE